MENLGLRSPMSRDGAMRKRGILPAKLTGDLLGEGRLTIREFQEADREGVQAICFSHFRSLCLAAVRYYITEHFQDLLVLTVLGGIFMKFTDLFVVMVLFNLYLFLKSRWEMEQYITKDCLDLWDISKTYMTTTTQVAAAPSCFWVAEVRTNADEKSEPQLVGCIGLAPSRENPGVAKLVRLVVDGSHRRMRIGSRLLLQLENYARTTNYTSVRIYTNTLNPSHMKFVRQHGYTNIQTIRRGLMRGDLVMWHKFLETSSNSANTSCVDTSLNTSRSDDENISQMRIRSVAQHVMD